MILSLHQMVPYVILLISCNYSFHVTSKLNIFLCISTLNNTIAIVYMYIHIQRSHACWWILDIQRAVKSSQKILILNLTEISIFCLLKLYLNYYYFLLFVIVYFYIHKMNKFKIYMYYLLSVLLYLNTHALSANSNQIARIEDASRFFQIRSV